LQSTETLKLELDHPPHDVTINWPSRSALARPPTAGTGHPRREVLLLDQEQLSPQKRRPVLRHTDGLAPGDIVPLGVLGHVAPHLAVLGGPGAEDELGDQGPAGLVLLQQQPVAVRRAREAVHAGPAGAAAAVGADHGEQVGAGGAPPDGLVTAAGGRACLGRDVARLHAALERGVQAGPDVADGPGGGGPLQQPGDEVVGQVGGDGACASCACAGACGPPLARRAAAGDARPQDRHGLAAVKGLHATAEVRARGDEGLELGQVQVQAQQAGAGGRDDAAPRVGLLHQGVPVAAALPYGEEAGQVEERQHGHLDFGECVVEHGGQCQLRQPCPRMAMRHLIRKD